MMMIKIEEVGITSFHQPIKSPLSPPTTLKLSILVHLRSSCLTTKVAIIYPLLFFQFPQNKRAKLKKSTGARGGLAMQLMAQGLYNHSTVPIDEDEEMYEALMQNK